MNESELKAESGARRARAFWYYIIFVASGFAGLIYQSLWARYLKLFLGNAAYAQVLVLAVFLAGLAVGSALAARVSGNLRRPLLVYAIAEVVVAVAAFCFHDVYVAAESWATDFVLPRADAAIAAELFRWSLAALLILPQSILLGATFPLMSAGLARMNPHKSGLIVSYLYFTNSLGASLGVLCSAFVFIPSYGLPGAGFAAGLINAFVALAVWILGKCYNDTAAPVPALDSLLNRHSRVGGNLNNPEVRGDSRLRGNDGEREWGNARLILLVAAVTGAASFVYEIVWIRMISLLVGSSSHSFEVMISVFILGLAIGGWIVRKRAQSGANPLALLAKVQFVMGALALASLFVYPHLFGAVEWFAANMPRSPTGTFGYNLYLLFSYGLSGLMMLPATICAGMTLPLLTKSLMRGGGESALGAVYAANTVGGIIGAVAAVHLLLPMLGVSLSIAAGAAMDLFLAVVLARRAIPTRTPLFAVAVCALLAPAVAFGGADPRVVGGGVYRSGGVLDETFTTVFHRDGKTSTISVFENAQEINGKLYPQRSIRTNGKPDAALIYGDTSPLVAQGTDEMTMTMAALLALLARPDAKSAANIGLGSGLTTAALLTSPTLRRVDTIEIERMMLEGAQHLGPRVARAFEDARSNIIIDDAKSYFARNQLKYDIIISEPSNPWISGVATLFSREFYKRIRNTLAPDGVFVQWTHFYESSPQLVASKMTALAESFSDFRLYISSGADLILIAVAEGEVPPFSDALFAADGARHYWSGYGYRSAADMDAIFIGDKKHFMPYLESFQAPVNSDYFPFVEHRAPLDFFRKTVYSWPDTFYLPVPVWELVTGRPLSSSPRGELPRSSRAATSRATNLWFDDLQNEESESSQWFAKQAKLQCPILQGGKESPPSLIKYYFQQISDVVFRLMPQAPQQQMARLWSRLSEDECMKRILQSGGDVGEYARFWRAVSLRDAAEMARIGELFLSKPDFEPNYRAPFGRMVLLATMAGNYKLGDYEKVLHWARAPHTGDAAVEHLRRFIAANAKVNAEKL